LTALRADKNPAYFSLSLFLSFQLAHFWERTLPSLIYAKISRFILSNTKTAYFFENLTFEKKLFFFNSRNEVVDDFVDGEYALLLMITLILEFFRKFQS
jgi:hypothetical protein